MSELENRLNDPLHLRAMRLRRDLLNAAVAVRLELASQTDEGEPDITRLRMLGRSFTELAGQSLSIAHQIETVTDPQEEVDTGILLEPTSTTDATEATMLEDPISRPHRQKPYKRAYPERVIEPFLGDPYETIALPGELPFVELPDEGEIARITVVTDTVIDINGNRLKLVGERLFVFNALLKLRAGTASLIDIKNAGFRGEGRSGSRRLGKVIRDVMTDVNAVAGREVIAKAGATSSTRYRIHPAAQLVDRRALKTA